MEMQQLWKEITAQQTSSQSEDGPKPCTNGLTLSSSPPIPQLPMMPVPGQLTNGVPEGFVLTGKGCGGKVTLYMKIKRSLRRQHGTILIIGGIGYKWVFTERDL